MATSANRVLLVTGPAAGGLKRHVETLAAQLPALGYEVTAAAPEGVFSPAVHRLPLCLGDRPRPVADLGALRQLRRAIAEWRPDLIHAHGVKAALLTLLAAPSGEPPVVVTYHNLWHGGMLTYPLRVLASRAAASIAVSDAVQASLKRHRIQARRLVVIRNGVDPSAFPDVRSGRAVQPFTALFMGRLTEEKGIPVLLAAVKELPLELPVAVLVAGDGPLRRDVEKSAGDQAAQVEYLGQVGDVLSAYRRADVVVLPSLSEGLPMTALEAMACGLPLVASRVGGLPEVVVDGETGLLISPGEPEALAEALHQLAGHPARAAEMGSAGRVRIAAEFTETRMLDRLAAVYRTTLKWKPSRAVEQSKQGPDQRVMTDQES